MKNRILNTEQDAATPIGAMGRLMEQMATGRAIEREEARGQEQLAESDVLPVNNRSREDFIRLDFVFGSPVEGDTIFEYVTFPAGWTKKPTSHSMWTDIIDPDGHERGAIFYKAAHYDRSAHVSLSGRYGIKSDSDGTSRATAWHVRDEKSGKAIFAPAGDDHETYRLCSDYMDTRPELRGVDKWDLP